MTSKDCSILINGHQLREALAFLAPDNTEEQLDQEVVISTGGAECHSGPGLYCWLDEYPEEGAIKLDGTSPAALSAPHEQAELWAVHVEGPDDLYAAFSREDAERHASELNAIQVPEGVFISAVVIPSPWGAVEHWQYLAEQEREHVESMRAALSAPPASVPAELTNVRCMCGDEYPHDSYGAGFIAGSGMCENCAAAQGAMRDAARKAMDDLKAMSFKELMELSEGTAPPAAGVPDSAYARRIIEAGEKLYNELRQWLATESDPDSQAALQEWREICAFTPPASEQQRAVVMSERAEEEDHSASTAAILFALAVEEEHYDGMTFLRMWNEGEFEAIRRAWPDCPDEVFIGADPLFKPSTTNNGGTA